MSQWIGLQFFPEKYWEKQLILCGIDGWQKRVGKKCTKEVSNRTWLHPAPLVKSMILTIFPLSQTIHVAS